MILKCRKVGKVVVTKQEILDEFNDINFVYNNSSKHETLSWMLDELLKEQDAVEPTINEYGEAYCICGENVGIIPSSKNLPSIRSKYCSECGRRMKWKYD